jgi:hypothetical protein
MGMEQIMEVFNSYILVVYVILINIRVNLNAILMHPLIVNDDIFLVIYFRHKFSCLISRLVFLNERA